MDDNRFTGSSSAEQVAIDQTPTGIESQEALRCDICARRLGTSLFFVEETGDVPPPRHSWVLCQVCNDAVHEQLELSSVRSAVRLRVAVGLVATTRTPSARRAHFGQLSDESWTKVFLWLLPITMMIHLAVIVVIAIFR